ncbi:DUF1843 domain-containing protein [Sorangium sp. So ce1000]|uniref:DUF1843 domain-containing protein n=1 Tax=Sorangium sp. So ce1000 TaxID=3133325 RepID=UPI003F629A9F
MTLQLYAPAIRDALARGDMKEMETLLHHAKMVHAEQGDLENAISELERAIEKLRAMAPP